MRTFNLVRSEDETGVSGTGRVAEGVVFSDGQVAMRWRTGTSSTAVYSSVDDVETIHGHGGKTRVELDEPVQVVGPGEVAVNRHGLYAYLLHTGKSPGPYTEALRAELRAALAAAEPTPDDEQGEKFNRGGMLRGPIPFEPDNGYIIPKRTRVAAPDSGQGEKPKWADLFGIDPTYPTPAAPGVGSGVGSGKFCTLCKASCHEQCDGTEAERCDCCGDFTPAAEPDRVTLPDSPWTTVRVTLDDGEDEWWHTAFSGVWFDVKGRQLPRTVRDHVVDFTILAEPPKADPAETGAPHEPTLALVVNALRDEADRREYDRIGTSYLDLATLIEAAGGDGSSPTITTDQAKGLIAGLTVGEEQR